MTKNTIVKKNSLKKKLLKTKKNLINSLKGGNKKEQDDARKRLNKFINNLDTIILNIDNNENAIKFGTNYPYILTYFDLKIIFFYIYVYKLTDVKNIYNIYDNLTLKKFSYINSNSSLIKDIFDIINRSCKSKYNFKIITKFDNEDNNIVNFSDYNEYTLFTDYLNKYMFYEDDKNSTKYFNIYMLLYFEKLKLISISSSNSNSNSHNSWQMVGNSNSNTNSWYNVKNINSNSNVSKYTNNNMSMKYTNNLNNNKKINQSIYKNILFKFISKYKNIFDENGVINKITNKDIKLFIIEPLEI